MDRFRHQLCVRNIVAAQLVSDDLPWLTTVASLQAPEETLCRPAVSARLEKHVNHFAILIHRTPQILLPAVDLYEDLVDEKGVAVPLMISLQPPGIFPTEFYAPETD